MVAQLRELIEPYVAQETRGLSSYEQFVAATSTSADVTEPDRGENPRWSRVRDRPHDEPSPVHRATATHLLDYQPEEATRMNDMDAIARLEQGLGQTSMEPTVCVKVGTS